MRFESEQGWIEIEFNHYAEDSACWRSGLFDEQNSVELGFDFSLDGIGWGCVGDEYFLTTDIRALERGASDVLCSAIDQFSHSISFPYAVLLEDKEFCRFSFCRCDEGIQVDLRIWDGLCEHLEIVQVFDEPSFAEIVSELKQATKKFPVREKRYGGT